MRRASSDCHSPAKPVAERAFASHHHDEEISSIGIEESRALDARKVNDWLSYLLQSPWRRTSCA